jgi:hypothetical protein
MRPLLTTGLLLLALPIFAQTATITRPAAAPPDFLTAFNRLPDTGALCSITLLVEKAWSPLAGHAFLQLTKSDGRDSVVRYLGFYRLDPKQALFSDQPVPAKITDDACHPYHASLRRQITPAELQAILRQLQRLSTARYQTYHFNSVDFALRILSELTLTDPVFLSPHSSTPGQLYRALKKRKLRVQDPRETILVGHGVQYTGASHTPTADVTLIHHP